MSIFGYPMDSWVHTGTLLFLNTRAREYTGGNSLWHSACPILWSNPILLRNFTKIAPSVLPCPKTQEHQSTCVDSWVHRVLENGHQPLGRGNSLWRSACPILWSNPTLLRYFTEIAPSVLYIFIRVDYISHIKFHNFYGPQNLSLKRPAEKAILRG